MKVEEKQQESPAVKVEDKKPEEKEEAAADNKDVYEDIHLGQLF